MRKQFLTVLATLVGGAAIANPQDNWTSLVSTDVRVAAPFRAMALAASTDGWWLLDGQNYLHRYVVGEIEPVMAAVSAGYFEEPRLYGTADDGVLLLGTLGLCQSPVQPCTSTIEARDARGERNWQQRVPGRCGVPSFEADGKLRVACGGRLYHYGRDGERISELTLFGSQTLLDSDHRELVDGGALLVARQREAVTAVVALDGNDQPHWRAQFSARAAAPVFTDDHLYLRFPGEMSATTELVVLRATDGVETGRTTIAGEITAAQGWLGRIMIGVADGAGQHRLLAIDPFGTTSGTLELGNYEVRAMDLTIGPGIQGHELLLGLDGELPSLGRLDGSGGYRQSSLGAAAGYGQMAPLSGGKVVVSSAPLEAEFWTRQIDVLDIANQRIGERLRELPTPRGSSRDRIDTDRAELWSAGVLGGPYISRLSFDGSAPTIHKFENLAAESANIFGAPVRTETHYCAATITPAQIFCAPLEVADGGFSLELPLEDDERVVAIAADDAGRLAILSERSLGQASELVRRVISADGIVDQASNAFPHRGFSSLGGLRGLMGGRIFVDGERPIAEVIAPTRGLYGRVGLADGGAVLATVDAGSNPVTAPRLERIDSDGVRLWEIELPSFLLHPLSALTLLSGENSVLVEPQTYVLINRLQDPQRTVYDLRDGTLLTSEPAYYDGQTQFTFRDVPAGGANTAFWRLSSTTGGIVAQRISATEPKVHIWLPCACSLNNAVTGADGKVYFELTAVAGSLLGIADLNALAASAPPPSGLAAERLHGDGVLVSGLVSGPVAGGSRFAAVQFDQIVHIFGGQTRSQWWHVEPVGRGERTLDFERRKPALQSASDIFNRFPLPHGVSLLPLAGPAWLLKERSDFGGDFRVVRQLQARPDSAATRLYFASADRWVALDEELGEAVWGLPDGHWYRLQQQPSGSWAVFGGDLTLIDDSTDATAAFGIATLRRQGCGGLELQLQSIAPSARSELGRELGRSSSFQASCR